MTKAAAAMVRACLSRARCQTYDVDDHSQAIGQNSPAKQIQRCDGSCGLCDASGFRGELVYYTANDIAQAKFVLIDNEDTFHPPPGSARQVKPEVEEFPECYKKTGVLAVWGYAA